VGARGYTVACFLTGFEGTKTVFDSYRERRAELGLPAAPRERFAYAALVYTGDTDAEGYAARPQADVVPGVEQGAPAVHEPARLSPDRVNGERDEGRDTRHLQDVPEPDARRAHGARAGLRRHPDSVYRQIMRMYEHVGGFGQLLMMSQAGFLDHEETVKGMQMFSREVYPRLKELP